MIDTYEMLEARQLLEAEQYNEALAMLDKTPAEERTAPWYYLRSQIEEKQACYYNSVTSLKKAIALDPENKEYKTALKSMEKTLKKDFRNSARLSKSVQDTVSKSMSFSANPKCSAALTELIR